METRKKRVRLIGDRAFYQMVLRIAIPIMVQNGITNMIGLVNNITVGKMGTEQLAGVAIANQLISIFNMCVFGAVSGAGIFGAQFQGKQDYEGVRHVFRLKVILMLVLSALAVGLFAGFGKPLIAGFLHEGSDGSDLALTLKEGYEYLLIMLIGFLPYGLSQAYSSTLREADRTVVPMRASIYALVLGVVLNYLLIPVLGVAGAALATVVSRFAELGMNAWWTHTHPEEVPFVLGVYHTLKVPGDLVKQVLIKGTPLLLNETLWSVGFTVVNQTYSYHGVAVVAAVNIATTIANLVNVLFSSMGASIGIIIGNMLGAGDMEKVKEADAQMITLSLMIATGVCVLMLICGPYFPQIYKNTTPEVRDLAKWFIWAEAIAAPLRAFVNASYFTLRSGGKTIITFLFDCGFVWCGNVVVAYVLTHFTNMHIVPIYFCCKMVEIIKCVIGFALVKKGSWMKNIVGGEEAPVAQEA